MLVIVFRERDRKHTTDRWEPQPGGSGRSRAEANAECCIARYMHLQSAWLGGVWVWR